MPIMVCWWCAFNVTETDFCSSSFRPLATKSETRIGGSKKVLSLDGEGGILRTSTSGAPYVIEEG